MVFFAALPFPFSRILAFPGLRTRTLLCFSKAPRQETAATRCPRSCSSLTLHLVLFAFRLAYAVWIAMAALCCLLSWAG